jgi:DNA modification methylase
LDNRTSFDLTVVYQPIAALLPHPSNARTHSRQQIRQLADSFKAFGFTNPVLIDHKNTIIAGHGRVAAAKTLGMDRVPTIRLENLNDNEIRPYILADNKLAELAGWDKEILAIELQHLMMLDNDLDITITGFEIPEIDLILEGATSKEHDPDDSFEVDEALEPASYKALALGRRVSVVFVDPPYNVAIDGHASGSGSIHHREFAMASDEMNEAEHIGFLTRALSLVARHSTSGSVHFICLDWRHMTELLAAGKQVYTMLLNLCVWVKDNGGLGSFYRSRHELVFVYRNGKDSHRNNVQLGKFGRNRTNVWEYAWINTLSRQGDEGNLLALHPTVKPVAMVADALLDCSARGEVVLDSFLGSGTTLIAAERVGHICYGIEIDPLYIDVAIRRWQKHTGDHALHGVTGKRFDDIATAEVSRG